MMASGGTGRDRGVWFSKPRLQPPPAVSGYSDLTVCPIMYQFSSPTLVFERCADLSKLLRLKEWLTVPDAARHLSILFGEEVGEADVLRLALDGQLRLSIRLLAFERALYGNIIRVNDTSEFFDPSRMTDPDKREDGIERAKTVLIDQRDNLVLDIEGEVHIDNVWDLLMRGGERYYVENEYQRLIDGPGVFSSYTDEGIYLRREADEGMAWRLRPELPDGMPNESSLVVRTAALQELEKRISNLEKPVETPLELRERTTLLVIIAALAKMAEIDLKKPSKAAAAIESETALMGARVSERTVLNHLNRIPTALMDRSED